MKCIELVYKDIIKKCMKALKSIITEDEEADKDRFRRNEMPSEKPNSGYTFP